MEPPLSGHERITLFHGTTDESAAALMKDGWKPRSGGVGGNMGQTKYLYLSTHYEDALWFAQEKGSDVVLSVEVDRDCLAVDPEDGVAEDLEGELALPYGLPGKLVATGPIPPEAFSRADPALAFK